MKRQFSDYSFYDLNEQQTTAAISVKQKTILICHAFNHWITITNINNNNCGKWLVLDSLNSEGYLIYLTDAFKKLAAFSSNQTLFSYQTVSLNKQIGSNDCGLFSIAYCLSLGHGKDPSLLRFKQHKMRLHYNKCVENDFFLQFPYEIDLEL